MADPDREKADRARQAMYRMSKIIVADLEAAYAGERIHAQFSKTEAPMASLRVRRLSSSGAVPASALASRPLLSKRRGCSDRRPSPKSCGRQNERSAQIMVREPCRRHDGRRPTLPGCSTKSANSITSCRRPEHRRRRIPSSRTDMDVVRRFVDNKLLGAVILAEHACAP